MEYICIYIIGADSGYPSRKPTKGQIGFCLGRSQYLGLPGLVAGFQARPSRLVLQPKPDIRGNLALEYTYDLKTGFYLWIVPKKNDGSWNAVHLGEKMSRMFEKRKKE